MKKLYMRNRLCIPIRGYRRSIIYDLLRNDYYFIPNYVFDIIDTLDAFSLVQKTSDEQLDEWLNLFLKEEIIFEVTSNEDVSLFPDVSFKFNTPFLITDIIVHDNLPTNLVKKAIGRGIRNLSVIISILDTEILLSFLTKVSCLEIDSISLILCEEGQQYNINQFKPLFQISQLFNVYLFNSKLIRPVSGSKIPFDFVELPYSFVDYSENLFPEKLNVNLDTFFESVNHHSYFNKKVYIDFDGDIKNGLTANQIFGNILDTTEQQYNQLIESDKFQRLWTVKKLETLICQDCEFRYMCMDTRIPYFKKGLWYHETECSYNPYIAKWNYEKNYKSLIDSGVELVNGKLKIDKESLSSIFQQSWQ